MDSNFGRIGTSFSDNSPDTLLQTCVRFIVTNHIQISDVSLPQEICNLLLEVYRDLNKNQNEKTCRKFLNQFKGSNTRITRGVLSELPIKDSCLESFLNQHSKNLVYLDINNCTHLTDASLKHINQILTRVQDFEKIVRSVKFIEENRKTAKKVTTKHKYYEGGVLTTTTNDDTTYQEYVGPVHTDYELYDAMGVFDDPSFVHIKEKIKSREKIDLIDPVKRSLDRSHSTLVANIASVKLSPRKTLPDFSSCPIEPIDYHNYIKDKEVFKVEISDDVVHTIEVKTWQKSPLQSLIIGRSQILPDYIEEDNDDDEERFLINPNLSLKKLAIDSWTSVENMPYLNYILTPQIHKTLQHLDLSNCSSIGDGSALLQLQSIKTLILYNCPKVHQAIHNLGNLTTLRFLDISTSNDRHGQSYKDPDKQLLKLVNSLPHLTHLDISGTNLAGPRCDHIHGLVSRHLKPFDYLGLYNTSNEAAYRSVIPALRVAGDATKEQILTACEVYLDRTELLRRALNDLFHCFRFETKFHDVGRALDVVLTAMTHHISEKQIQIAASASLFYIVKSDEAKHNFNIKTKRAIITKLLDAMQIHRYDITMLRNGSLTLIHFKIPQDVTFEYARLVDILLHIVTSDDDEFIQRLACQVDGEQKALVGNLGAIEKMLSLIEARLNRKNCDEVMETAWSTMWNVTDETPINCERFLKYNGMEFFVQCMQSFPDNAELLRNMMGLLGNVAECQHLRHRLMKPEYIQRFILLLDSESDGIEVSYNAAGILSHIAYDGIVFWETYLPSIDRNIMIERMKFAILKWKINSKRNINYRSFKPILKLLSPEEVNWDAQYWAVWALANLTRAYCGKYCPLLIEDGGIDVLQRLLSLDGIPEIIEDLTRCTLYQIKTWQEKGNLDDLEKCEKIKYYSNLYSINK